MGDGNAFVLGFLDFPGAGGHLFPVFQADDLDLGGILALGGAGYVHGHVAAADDEDFFAGKVKLLARG